VDSRVRGITIDAYLIAGKRFFITMDKYGEVGI
jgi:hypothetical protein